MDFFGDLKQSELEQFFPEEEVKRAYTEDENYRAYKMFSMMDVDNGGAISLREIKRVLMGESVRYVSAEFDHPDSGIVFGFDEEKCVIIVDIEMDSAATKFPYLMQRMRLYRINNFVVKKHHEKALNEVFQELLRLHDEPVRLEFYEPEIIINKFTCFLDIEVDGEVFSVVLPIGAVYNHVLFCDRIRQLLCDTSMMLDHIEVDFIPEKRQILFRSYEEPFRLLFGTGPNFRRSCRYTLGFEGEDYPYAYEHAGQPMLMDLQLGVSQAQAEILMQELFLKYDRDQSGEFEFEEFRDFYIRYLDSEDSLDRLRKYALYRFRDIEKEKFVLKQRQDRKNKLKRREYLRDKNAEITKAQRARFLADSFVDAYGNRRRIYRHRTVNRLTSEGDKQITLLKEENELAEDAFDDLMKATRTTLASAMSGGGDGGGASVTSSSATTTKKSATGAAGAAAEDEDSVVLPTGFHATVLNRHEVRMRARMMQKQKQQQQAIRRKDVLRRMVQANQALQLQQRQNARLHQDDAVDMQTMDLHYRIKRELSQSVDVSANELYENIQSYGVDVSRLITTPAVKITSAILGDRLDRDSIDVSSMPSSVVHPASQYYYHVKENQRSSKATFDAERLNPTFFTADYVRQPSRHSNHAFGMAKIMYRMRQEGVRYRITHGLEASLQHTYPPDEDLAAFLEEKRKWEEANDPQRLLKTSTNQRKKVSFKEIEPVGQRGLLARLTIVSIKLDQLASVHAFAKNSPFVNVYIGSYKFVTEAYSYAGSTCEWDDLNWVVRLYAKDTLQLDVFSGSATNYAYVGSHRVSSAQIMEIRYEVDNVIVISGKLYNPQVAALQQQQQKKAPTRKSSTKKGGGGGGVLTEEETHPPAMGVFHLRANLEKGKDWDWFIQNYEKNQARAERLAKEKQRLSHTYTGPKEWLNIRTYFPLEVQIVNVVLFDVHSSLASWIYNSRITLTLDAGRSEYTTDEQYAVINRQDSAEWNKLQWEFTIESPEVHLIYKIYAHGKYIGRYVLSAATLAEKLTVTTHELEFTGELVVNLGAGDAKVVGKVMTKMLVNPLSGQEITRYRELHPTTPTIEDHLRPDYLVALPAVVVFEQAELSATNLHSISFQGTYILRLHYEHYRFETRIEVPSRTKRVLIPALDWQIPLHDRRKVTLILEHVAKGPIAPEPPAVVHFQTDEFCALEKNADSGVLLRKFVFVDNEIKAKVAFYATVSLERDYVAIDRLLHDIDPTHNLRVVDPVYTKDGLVMVEGNQEFWEMQGKYYRSGGADGSGNGSGNGSGTARSSRYEPPPVGEEETKRGGNGMLTLEDLRGSTTSLPGTLVDDGGGSRSVRTGALVASSNISLPVTLQVTELLVTDLYGVHYLVKNSPRVHVVVGSQAECTTVSNRSGAHAFWSGLDMKFTIQNYDTSIRISVDSQETVIGECVIAIPTLFSCRPNKTGMREILSTLTLTMKTPATARQPQAQHQIRGKVKCLYFIDQANKLGIPTSDVQLGALKYINYPIQLVIQQIAVTNLRAVHLFGRNSPWVKMMELDPTHTKFFSTSMLKQAGGFGRWKQLMWSSVLRDEVTTFHFQVLSESMVIGATLVSADALLHMVPTKEGTCEMVLPLTSIENHLRGGELQLTYSYEPYVEEDEEDEEDAKVDGATGAATDGAGNDGGLSAPSTASTSSFFSLRGGPRRPQLSSPFSTSSALSFRTNPHPPATVNTALPISSDAVVKDHRLVMLCTMVIVLRKPKARKVAAAKNHRATNPEEYPIWNLSTTRAQIVCGKYIHAVRLKCQHLPSHTAATQRPIWAESGGDDASSSASLWSEDTRNHRNNSSIILRSAPLIEKFVVSASKPVYIRLFDGNDLTIGDSAYSYKDMVETSPLTSSGFHVCDRDLWKDGELVGLVRMQVRVTEDIPPIIRATLIDGNLQLQSQHSSTEVHHPSVWTAERRLMYPLGVRFSHVSMVDIDVEKLIPSALLQVPVERDEEKDEAKDDEGKAPGDRDGDSSPAQTVAHPVAEIKVKQVEIFCRIRFAGELRSSVTSFALSSDMYEAGLVWEFADTAYSIAHDQEVWILEIAALGKILGICKIPAFDLRYARELHIRQTSDEQQSVTSVTDLLRTLPDSTLYFNVWNAHKEVTGRIMVQFNLHELFLSGDDDDRQRSLQMIAATPRSAPASVVVPGVTNAAGGPLPGGTLTSASPIGFIRFVSLRAHELRQLYPLFSNSPRVRITIGERVYETKEIPESGGEGVWERIAWGRINLRPSIAKLAFSVLSHNEVIGTWEMTMEEFVSSIRRAKEFAESGASPSTTNEPPVTVDGSGAVTVQLTGVLWKNRRMMGNLTMRFVGRLSDDDDRAKKGIVNESTERRGLLRQASAFFARRASSPNLKQPLTENSASLVIGERSSTLRASTAAEESNHPLPAPETALAPTSSIVSSSQSMDGVPIETLQQPTPTGGVRQAMQAVLDAADMAHHPQMANNSFASSYNGGQPPVGAVAPQNTLSASLSASLEGHPTTALPETIDFQFVALSVSHIRRNPNEEAVEFTFKNPPKLFVTCGGWAVETIKLSTVSENAVTTQFKWLVSRYPAWHFRTEGTPFMKVSLQTSDTKRLLGTVFIAMTDLLQTPTDHIGLMHMGRTLMSPNDEPVAHLELVYRVVVRIQEDTPPPWWLNTAMDPNRLNQSWSMLSASLTEHMPRPDQAAAFVRDLSNPRIDEDSKTLFSSTSTLSMNTLHRLMPGDTLAAVDADVMAGPNDFQLVTPVVHPPFVLWITRAALTQIQTPGWMLESDAMRNMIVIRAVTHYTGYATATIATAANEVFWEELEGHVDDEQATLSLPPPASAAASTAGGDSTMMSPTTARTGPSEGRHTAETGAADGGDGMFENIARDRAWQFRFFDLQETLKIEVFNLAKPFGTCGLMAQDLLKLPRTMQGEVEIHLPVTLGRKDVAQLHFTGYILPLPRPEEHTEEKTVASVASELQAIERNEHLSCIMRLKYISCEDISVMAHEIRVKMVSEHEGTQVSPLLKNLYGRVQYAPTSWADVKFFQRSLVTFSVIDHRGEVLGATTMDVYDIQRAPIDQRPLTALTNDSNTNDDTARPGTGGTHSPGKDDAYANWVDTGSHSPRSQRRRRRKQRLQNIAVVYLDLILGPAKRGRIALAFERLSPSQYRAAIADDNLLSARSDITEDEPVIRQLNNDWGITISQIRLSHLKPVHQFGKNSPMVTLEVSGRKFQSDCRAFAGKKATFEDLSWMIDCREKLALKFKVTSASVTVGTCSILIDELYEHTLDKHFEMEVERTLVKDKKEMGSICIRLQGHPPLPPLSTNTGYIDSAGSIVTIRTQGENQTMHFRPVDLVSNVDYQGLLVDNMEGYRVLQEMDVQTVRLTIASSNRASSSPWDHSEPYDDSGYDDASTIRTYEDDYTNVSHSRRDELDDAMQSLADEIDDASHPSFHSGGMALLSKQHSEASLQPPSMGDEEMHSPSVTALSRKSSIRSGTHSPVPPRKQSRDEVSHASKVHFSEGHSLPMGSSPELKKQRSTNSLLPPLRPGSVPTAPSSASHHEPLPGSIDRNQPSQMLTSRSWDGGISNQPASTVTEAGRPRTSRGPEAPRFVPKLLPPAVVEDTNGHMLSSASLPSLPSQSQSRRQSTVDPRRQSVLSKAGSRRYSLGSALEGTISLPEESSADDDQLDGEATEEEGGDAGEHESKGGSALQRSVSFSNSQRRGSDDITSATSSSMPESTVDDDDDASSVGTSTIAYARPYGIADPDGNDSLYSNRSSLRLEDDHGDEDTRSNADTLSMPTSARSEASGASFYSQSSRSSTATSTATSSRTSSHATTPREPQETGIAVVDEEDQSPETFTPPAALDVSAMVPGPMQKQPSQSSLRSILKPSSRGIPDDETSGTGTATTGAEDEGTEDDDESTESNESSTENETTEDAGEGVSGVPEDDEEEVEEDDDTSSTTSRASSATSMSSKTSASSSVGRVGDATATATRLTRGEMEEIARQQPIPSLRLLFLRDEQPIPQNQMALLLATDLTRAIIVQVVSSLVAMSEGTSFMGARRQVARTLQLDVERLPLAQRRTLISVDFIRQVVFAAGTQAYQKVVIDRRVADIEATQPPLPQTVENPETEQPKASKGKSKSKSKSKAKAKMKPSAASAEQVASVGNEAVGATGADGNLPNATAPPSSSPPLSPTTRSSRKTLVKRMSVDISPKANMKKRQAVTMTSGLTNPMIEKRQQSQEWSDKLEKEMERKLMLSKPMRARVRILDLLGLDLGTIDAQVRPSRPYLTACKPFGNWAAETPVVKLETVKPLPPALQAKRDAARAEGKTDDEVSLPSIWQETAAFDAGTHPAAAPMAYVLNFTELFGKYRWEEFVLRLGQELLLEIRDAGSNLIIAKSVLPYTQLLSKLPGDQEIFESPLFVVFTVANEFGGGTLSGVLRVRLDLSVNVFVRTKKSASYWDQYRAQHWMVYPLTPINFGAVRQKFREIAEDYDKQRLIHPSYFGFKVRIRGNEEDESRFLHPVFSGYNLARKLAIAKSASKDAKVQAMKTRAANPFRYDPSLKDLGKCPICGDGLPGCPRCFMMPTRDFDGSFYAPREFAFDPAEERKKAMQREQRIVALKAKRRRRLSSLQFSSIAELNLESLGLSQLLSHEKIMTTGMSMADISKEITKMYEQEMHTEVTQEEQREQALLRKLHTRMTTFNSVRAARLFLQRVLNIYVKIMPTGHTIRLTMLTNDPVHLLYDRFNWHFPTQKNHHPMILLPTSNGFFELHPEIAWENEMEIADNRGYDPLGAFFQIQDQTCSSFVVLYYANYIRQAVAPMVQSFFAANTTFALTKLPTYTGMDRAPKDLVKDEVQQWFTKVISVEYRLQQEESRAFYHQLGRAYHASAIAAKQKEQVRSKQAKEFSAQQKKLIQQRFASQLKRLGTAGGKTASRDVKTRQRMLEQLESRERNKRKTQLFVDEKDNLLQTVKDDDTVAQTFGVSTKKPRGGRGGEEDEDDDLESVLSLSAVQLDDLPMDSEMFPDDDESASSYYSDDYTRSSGDSGSGSGSEYYSGSESYGTGSYADDALSTSDRSQSTSHTETVSATEATTVKSTKVPPLPVNEDGRIFPAASSAAAVLQHHRQDQAHIAQTLAQLRRDSKGGHPTPAKGRLSTIPSLSLHDDTLSISQQTEPSELSYTARSMTSHLTESDYYGSEYTGSAYTGSAYTGSDYTGSDYTGSDYTGSDYGSDNDFRSLSDAESSIASRSQYSYSPMNSARSTSTVSSTSSSIASQTPRSQITLDTAVTPYTVISQQSLQPYPSEVADEDSLPPANLIGTASANRQVSRTQLSRTQQDAQRRLQQTLRDETVQLQDQLLGDRLPSTLEQQERPRRRRSRDDDDHVLLDIAPEANGGLVPVQDVDDALSLFSGHRRHQYPSAHEQRALDRLMLAKKKKIHRVLRPHEDAYGVGRDGALTGGGNVDDQASLYSQRRLEDDQSSTGDDLDHDQSLDASQTDASSLYSMATSVTSRSTASDPDDVSSLATSQSGLFTFRDDVSLPSKAMYRDMEEEINVISLQQMPEDESTLRHRRTVSKKPKTISGTVSEHFETSYLQGKRDGDEESSVDGAMSLYSHPSADVSSTSTSSASHSMLTSESQSQTQSSTTSHPSGRQPSVASHSKHHSSRHRHQQHHPAFAGPAFPSLPDDDGDDDGDEVMSQVTFQTQTSQRSLVSHGDEEDEEEEETRSFAQASQSTASSQSPSVFSQYTPYYSTSSATQLSSTASLGTARSSVYSGAGSTASMGSQGSSSVSASGTSTASSATFATGGSTNEDETTRNTRYNRRYQGYGYVNPPTDSESGVMSSTYGEGDSTALSSARSASSQSLDSRSSYDSYVTASSAHSSDASSFTSCSYVTASEGTERSTLMDSSAASSMWSRGSETGSRLASSSLLGPLTETPSTTTRTLGSTSMSFDTRRSMTTSTYSSRFSGYGYLDADGSTVESATLDPTLSNHTEGLSDDSHLDEEADDGEDDGDDGSSVLSESSYASSLSSSSSFVRRKKAVREIAQAMSEVGDTDMEPIAALPMVIHAPKSPPKGSASTTLPSAFTTL